MAKSSQKTQYTGFEQGPIRPPSEAYSLLIRVTRNCPWNKCKFCPVYKGETFSLRPVEHVKRDIDAVAEHVDALRKMSDGAGQVSRADIDTYMARLSGDDRQAFQAALHWFAGGMESVFLQDANSLIIKPPNLVDILQHLKQRFPWIVRITSYARSHTVARIKDEELLQIARAGLNRVHIGMESGSDAVLDMVRKGSKKQQHIKAGQKVVKAGMELSEYVMPGLGGKEFSEAHAKETADALNQINPDFIRLRTLAIPRSAPLFEDYEAGRFEKLTDVEVAREVMLFLQCLDGIESKIKSDHILNLFQDLEGKLPEDRGKMIRMVQRFLNLSAHERMLYQVGRRLGHLRGLDDLENANVRREIETLCNSYGVQPDNVDQFIDEMMKRFI